MTPQKTLSVNCFSCFRPGLSLKLIENVRKCNKDNIRAKLYAILPKTTLIKKVYPEDNAGICRTCLTYRTIMFFLCYHSAEIGIYIYRYMQRTKEKMCKITSTPKKTTFIDPSQVVKGRPRKVPKSLPFQCLSLT